jgi:hypothetical protein
MNSDDYLLHQSGTSQQTPTNSFKSFKLYAIFVALLLSAVLTGTGGYILGMRNNQSVHPSQSQKSTAQSSVPSPSSSSIQAAVNMNWKMYSDIDYGYQANYPQEFTSTQMGANILFGSESVGISMYRELSQNANPDRETIDLALASNYLAEWHGGYYRSVRLVQKLTLEEIIIDGKIGVKVMEQLSPEIDRIHIKILIPRGKDILWILFIVEDNLTHNPDAVDKVNNFISTFTDTFRFLD